MIRLRAKPAKPGRAVGLALVVWLLASCSDTKTQLGSERTTQASAAINNSPTISNFVLYAERSVTLGDQDQVWYGDIGVGAGAVSSFGPQLTVGQQVQTSSSNNLIAPSVVLGSQCQVGDVQTNAFTNDGAQSYGNVATYPASTMPPLPLGGNPGSPGSDVNVAAQGQVTLSPGAYGALTIGDQAQVTLAAGVYSFSSVTLSDQVQVWTDPGGVTLLDGGTLSTGIEDQIVPLAGGTAADLTILVGGSDGSGGTPFAANVGQQSQITALLAVPHGTLSVALLGQLTGAFAAFDIALGDDVQAIYQAGFSASTPGQQTGSQQLSGYITSEIASAPLVGPVPPQAVIDLAIGLPLSDPAGLQTFIQSVSDPTSPQYRQYVKGPADFASRFGPSNSDYSKLQMFAQGAGFTVAQTFPNNLLVHVYASASIIESALYTNLSLRQRPDGSTFYAPDVEPSLDFAVPVLRISGLDNYMIGTPGAGGSGGGWTASRHRFSERISRPVVTLFEPDRRRRQRRWPAARRPLRTGQLRHQRPPCLRKPHRNPASDGQPERHHVRLQFSQFAGPVQFR